jgi:hypothetical protein
MNGSNQLNEVISQASSSSHGPDALNVIACLQRALHRHQGQRLLKQTAIQRHDSRGGSKAVRLEREAKNATF